MTKKTSVVRRAGLMLVGLLSLAACGQGSQTTQTTPTQPSPVATMPVNTVGPTRSLGLYELSVNGLGEGQGKLSLSVGRAGIGAQASEIGGLTFTAVSNSTLTDTANKVLHLSATFNVTNTTGATIALPTYIPVDTAGSYATDGETPFRNVVSRKGAAITPPAGMVVERARQLSGTTIQEDPGASPLLGNLDTAALALSLPSGTTAPGISHQGWQTAAIAPGESRPVNFAISVPLQGNDVGDNDPFRFSLIFAVADSPAAITPALTPVGAVQGSTPGGNADSPLKGQTVTVEGVVTSYLSGLNGYFVQEEGLNADQDSTTSNGIFVYCGNSCSPLNTGDVVRVTGSVAEFNGATQIVPTGVTKLASGVPVPAAVTVNLPVDRATLERYEGMRLSFPQTLTVTNNFTYGRYGQLDLSNDGRIFNPTNGNGFTTKQSFITLDDGISAQNPASLNYLSAQGTRRTGDTVTGLSGVWHAVANTPMLEPEGAVNFVDANPRLSTPKAVGGSLRVGGANVLNYFTTFTNGQTAFGQTGQGCQVGTTTTASNCRGADNATEFKRQRDKMVQTLTGLNADVLTLMEVQNDNDVTLNDIVAALNEKAGAGTYAAVSTGRVGTDAIHVAIIYKPGKVIPVGNVMIDTNSVYSRPPVAQTFRDRGTNGVFTVVANHLKSKGSCPSSGDVDNGQGCWNNLRVDQARQLLNFVQTIKSTSGDQDVLLMGDFNAYGDEDPIKTIVAGTSGAGAFESLNKRIDAADRYSYQFGGLFGYLDHALASSNLSSQVTGITEWHVNSDEPIVADYNTEFKNTAGCTGNNCTGQDLYNANNPFRASDHDPVVVGLNLSADAGTTPQPSASTALSANPASLSVTAGGDSASSTLSTSSQNYAGPLTVSTSNSAGLSVTSSAGSVGANSTFTVSVSAPAGTAAGTYPVTVTTKGSGGTPTATATLNVTVGSPSTGGGAATPWVNEINYDTSATNDAGEFIEVAVPAGVDTGNLSLVLYNGNGGKAYQTDLFSSSIVSRATVGTYTLYTFSYATVTNGAIQNGAPDGIAICNSSALVQFISYEGTFTATDGCANGVASTSIGSASQDNSSAPDSSLQLTGTGNKYSDFTWTGPLTNTKGAVNTGQTLN